MVTEEPEGSTNRRLVRRWFEEGINGGDPTFVREFVTDDVVGHGFGGDRELHGPEELEAFFAEYFAAFPEVRYDIEELVADDGRVATRFGVTGTHEGSFVGIEATGNEIDVPGMTTHRIDEGRVAGIHVVFDTLRFYRQLTDG